MERVEWFSLRQIFHDPKYDSREWASARFEWFNPARNRSTCVILSLGVGVGVVCSKKTTRKLGVSIYVELVCQGRSGLEALRAVHKCSGRWDQGMDRVIHDEFEVVDFEIGSCDGSCCFDVELERL